MSRELTNGQPRVRTGVVYKQGIECLKDALKIASGFQGEDKEHIYHVTGVEGDYKVIQYELKPKPSRYIKES